MDVMKILQEEHVALEVKSGAMLEVRSAKATGHQFTNGSKNLKDIFPSLQKGYDVHLMSYGNWSSHELILYLISQIGPSHLTFSTWSLKEQPVRMILQAIEERKILSVNAILDARVRVRNPEVMALAKNQFTRIREYDCHAKVSVLWGDDWQVTIVGSANMTNNPRVEACVVSTNPDVASFHLKWIHGLIDSGEAKAYD